MYIHEMREARRNLEKDIGHLLHNFNESTGLRAVDIEIDLLDLRKIDDDTVRYIPRVTVTVQL